jgi:hypothetical protein
MDGSMCRGDATEGAIFTGHGAEARAAAGAGRQVRCVRRRAVVRGRRLWH